MPAKKKTNLQLSKGTDSMEINLMQGDGELLRLSTAAH
jgi:hypothetical protein